jgi:hypothetical protein
MEEELEFIPAYDDLAPSTPPTPVGFAGPTGAAPSAEPNNPFEPLTCVPGLVGDLVDWITATARRPNRVLALGAAVTIIGTLIGRRVAGPTNSATHLYVATLSPTGAGKQHALDCIQTILRAAKASQLLGTSQFVSMPAVINFILRKPLSLCVQDEFGAFLKRMNGRRASGWEASISQMLRSLWGVSFNSTQTPEWAGKPAETIYSPAISIYGVSTPTEFFEALQASDLTNGFLNRFLVISSGVRAPEATPQLDPRRVPNDLASRLQALFFWRGSLMTCDTHTHADANREPDTRPWASQAAEDLYMDFARSVEKKIENEPSLESFIARSAEIAVRLATIRAVGRWGYDAKVDVEDIRWGATLAAASGEKLISDVPDNMIVELSHGQIFNKVLGIIKARRRVSKRHIFRSLQGSLRKTGELDAILQLLVESGTIALTTETPPGGGRPSAVCTLI